MAEIASEVYSYNSAVAALKKGLENVKISKKDVAKIETELQNEEPDMWKEKCQVAIGKDIAFDGIEKYLDSLLNNFEGIDADLRQKMNGILCTKTSWEYKIVEWKFNKGDNPSVARYCMFVFGRSPDLLHVDCALVLYNINFKIAPKKNVKKDQNSALWGLITWTTEHVETEDNTLSMQSVEALQNFFRWKALKGFCNEGLIENIRYVDRIDDVPNSTESK